MFCTPGIGTITLDDTLTIFQLLQPISSQWNKIGHSLRVDFDFRRSLELSVQNNDDRLEKVLHKWIESECSSVTWEHLIHVLKTDLDNKSLAEKVKYRDKNL